MVWALASNDYDKARTVFYWPLRAALRAFRDQRREKELDQYRYDLLIWTLRAPWRTSSERPPDPPAWTIDWQTPKVIRG
ncbi:MAG: hypothetical protein A2V88_02645 [Elusimicrobia bacterium RBG_16_66_12]|nr:MAG: hypothetical protein A2V88_02645 [Elusimicrobia bacterium RBG_16_66_12]